MLLLLDDQSNSFSISISMDWLSKKQDLKDEWMLDVGASSTLEMCELADGLMKRLKTCGRE